MGKWLIAVNATKCLGIIPELCEYESNRMRVNENVICAMRQQKQKNEKICWEFNQS